MTSDQGQPKAGPHGKWKLGLLAGLMALVLLELLSYLGIFVYNHLATEPIRPRGTLVEHHISGLRAVLEAEGRREIGSLIRARARSESTRHEAGRLRSEPRQLGSARQMGWMIAALASDPPTDSLFASGGHYSPRGNSLVARSVAEALGLERR